VLREIDLLLKICDWFLASFTCGVKLLGQLVGVRFIIQKSTHSQVFPVKGNKVDFSSIKLFVKMCFVQAKKVDSCNFSISLQCPSICLIQTHWRQKWLRRKKSFRAITLWRNSYGKEAQHLTYIHNDVNNDSRLVDGDVLKPNLNKTPWFVRP